MNRCYFFEDDPDSDLSSFYRLAYPSRADIVFVSGVANLLSRVESFLEREENLAIVLIDLVPDNTQLEMRYRELADLSTRTGFRCVVLPIVCAEYYYLRSLEAERLSVNNNCFKIKPIR